MQASEPPELTEEDQLRAFLGESSYYLPIAETQHPPPDFDDDCMHTVAYKSMVVCTFAADNWIANCATFGAAMSTNMRRKNVSFFLKLIQWAFEAEINVYLENLYDEVLANVGVYEERAKRLWIPIPEDRCEAFVGVVNASLKPEGPPAKKRARKEKVSASEVEEFTGYDTYVSHKKIKTESDVLDVVSRLMMCQTEYEVSQLDFTMLESLNPAGSEETMGDDALVQEASVMNILSIDKFFRSELCKEQYEDWRIPDWQRDPLSYMDDEFRHFVLDLNVIYQHHRDTIRMLKPSEGFFKRECRQPSIFSAAG